MASGPKANYQKTVDEPIPPYGTILPAYRFDEDDAIKNKKLTACKEKEKNKGKEPLQLCMTLPQEVIAALTSSPKADCPGTPCPASIPDRSQKACGDATSSGAKACAGKQPPSCPPKPNINPCGAKAAAPKDPLPAVCGAKDPAPAQPCGAKAAAPPPCGPTEAAPHPCGAKEAAPAPCGEKDAAPPGSKSACMPGCGGGGGGGAPMKMVLCLPSNPPTCPPPPCPPIVCPSSAKKPRDYQYRCESRELRGGNLYTCCNCLKRNGLQHDCPRTPCQGRPPCLVKPWPECWPSGGCHGVDTSRQNGVARYNPCRQMRMDGGENDGKPGGKKDSDCGGNVMVVVCPAPKC